MQLKALFAAALLPALALANNTTTCTSTTTLTKTVTLERIVATETALHSNSTLYIPTGAGNPTATRTTGPSTVASLSAGMSLEAAQYAFVGVAGMVVAALM
jgi:hypothetical protein